MENQDKEIKEEVPAVDLVRISPFGGFDKTPRCSSLALPDDHLICFRPVAKADEKEPGLARPDFTKTDSLQALIESYKDETGLAYALRQINAGRLHPFQLNDNGKKGVDLTRVPDNINEARAAALASHDQAARLAKALGVDVVDPAHLDKSISEALAKKVKSVTPKEVNENE